MRAGRRVRGVQFRAEPLRLFAIAAIVVLGAIGAGQLARLFAPLDLALSLLLAYGHPWQILTVEAAKEDHPSRVVLRLTAEVRRNESDSHPAALVVARVQAGAVAESPVVFWTLLLLWPANSGRARVRRLLLGIPVFVLLHAATTVAQLMAELPAASALVAGVTETWTAADYWSKFLEAGGRIALDICVALLTVAAANRRSAAAPALTAAP